MKKNILFLSLLVIFTLSAVVAQENKIQSTGNVGIGTANPRYLLQVQKTSTEPAVTIGGGFSGSSRIQLYDLNADPAAWMGLGIDMSGNFYEHSIYFPTAPVGVKGRLTFGDYNGSTYNTRMSILNNGNVGIGTLNPKYLLQVQKTSNEPAMMISGELPGSPRFQLYDLNVDPTAWMGLGTDMSGNSYEHSIYFPTAPTKSTGRLTFGNYNGSTYNARMSILDNGKIGIGTMNPLSNLELAGAFLVGGANLDERFPFSDLSYLSNSGKMLIGWNRSGGGGETDFIANQGGGNIGGFSFYNYSNSGIQNQLLSINANGNVGIGTKSTDEKLAVNGNIRAREIKVENTNWPDYVFDQEYQITPIAEIEKFIKLHKHLEGIPTADEVHANGINLSEMNAVLLKKIEELTLIVIEQNKRIEKLETK